MFDTGIDTPRPTGMLVVERWGCAEVRVPGRTGESWIDVGVEATFTCGSQRITARGFAAGVNDVRVRFAPPVVGYWRYVVTRHGQHVLEGELECVPAGRTHGPVRAVGASFVYDDGAPYTPFGTTLYAWTHQPAEVRALTLRSLAASPFTKVRMCIFPKGMTYNRTPPTQFPFERASDGGWNVHRPNPDYWNELDRRIAELGDLGIEADLILFHPYDRGPEGPWGFSRLPMEDCLAYLRYCGRRLAAFPNVWWSLGNEYDMLAHRTMEDWVVFGEQLRAEDSSSHLISCHNWIKLFDFDLSWVTHCSIQSDEVHRVRGWRDRYGKPVVVDELGYEGDLVPSWGHLSAFELVHRIWCVTVAGGFATHGETFFRDDEMIWWSKGGVLRGDAPPRIRFLRELLDDIGGPIEPRTRGRLIDPNGMDSAFVQNLTRAFEQTDPVRRDRLEESITIYEASVGDDDVIIRYLGRSAQSVCDVALPAGNYAIELVDVWQMTRRMVLPDAAGTVSVPLPATEGTAIVATRLKRTQNEAAE
jgi:hypothetical protein